MGDSGGKKEEDPRIKYIFSRVMSAFGIQKALVSSALMSSATFFIFGAMQGSLWVGFLFVINGTISFGNLTAFQVHAAHASWAFSPPGTSTT